MKLKKNSFTYRPISDLQALAASDGAAVHARGPAGRVAADAAAAAGARAAGRRPRRGRRAEVE